VFLPHFEMGSAIVSVEDKAVRLRRMVQDLGANRWLDHSDRSDPASRLDRDDDQGPESWLWLDRPRNVGLVYCMSDSG
jgi:hypothetical protein